MSSNDWSVCDVSRSSHCINMAQWWLDLARCNLKHYSATLLAMVTVTLDSEEQSDMGGEGEY